MPVQLVVRRVRHKHELTTANAEYRMPHESVECAGICTEEWADFEAAAFCDDTWIIELAIGTKLDRVLFSS